MDPLIFNVPKPMSVHFGEELGRGAFGVVFKGEIVGGELHGSSCAVKTISCNSKQQLQSAFTEVQNLSQLRHANIIRVLNYAFVEGIFDKIIHIVMEFCNGKTLSNRLMHERSDRDHLKWMMQMSSGLEYLHGKGIAHRDLKPDNILLFIGGSGELLKLSDFGLSKQFLKRQQDGKLDFSPLKSLICPLLWAAPEVIRGDTYDTKADVFSLGAICYGMLEECYIDDGNMRCHSAFVYIPGTGKIQYGRALLQYPTLKMGFSLGFNDLTDSLKKETDKMLTYNPTLRSSAGQLKLNLTVLVSKINPQPQQENPGIPSIGIV